MDRARLHDEFLNALAVRGGSAGNKTLRAELGWPEEQYDDAKAGLLASGVIEPGRGRGGSVRMRESDLINDRASSQPQRSAAQPTAAGVSGSSSTPDARAPCPGATRPDGGPREFGEDQHAGEPG